MLVIQIALGIVIGLSLFAFFSLLHKKASLRKKQRDLYGGFYNELDKSIQREENIKIVMLIIIVIIFYLGSKVLSQDIQNIIKYIWFGMTFLIIIVIIYAYLFPQNKSYGETHLDNEENDLIESEVKEQVKKETIHIYGEKTRWWNNILSKEN